ncbi:DAK2 domain-containing protein [Corynebacterium meitnerae]|uniref:DAK2 domain-containing protein n=1 Tax=Corynebacterium meitnerae TaxID=2913498 RepID=A0A9X3RJC5_9CORY|nr:DAK2 domain-containing protein [Corynebacterium meitnerae]MCZ9292897.1 DAK2 domain-containing protein [Corynebacterium meitnerae]
MTSADRIDGPQLLSWARRSAEELGRHREVINSLNVFPVPDSDTGSNMAFTMAAAVKEAGNCEPAATADVVAEALAVGSIKGARGNSGVVLSQVLRGVAQAAGDGELGGRDVAKALANAVAFVERAIADPVEGTIITVLREAARAAKEASISKNALSDITSAALTAAEDALANTPSQLAELREAGVVDAGGTGLVLLLKVLHAEVTGGSIHGSAEHEDLHDEEDTEHSHGVAGWLEVLFMFTGPLDELEAVLSAMGRSLVIARATDTHGKVHIHTTEAGPVIERALELGTLTDLRLEILPDATPMHEARRVGRLIVAITPGGSLMDLYNRAGAVAVAPGPDVIEDVRREITASGAHEVIILPNGQLDPETVKEIEAAADQASLEVTLLPTVRLVNGIAAVSVHDPRLPVSEAAALMSEAAEEMAVADILTTTNGVEIVARDTLVVRAATLTDAVREAATIMLDGGGELVTILVAPRDVAAVDVEALEADLDAEVVVYPADGLGSTGQLGVE